RTCDDLYSLAMLHWKVQGDRAVGSRNEEGADESPPDAKLRKIGVTWKIDVSDETEGDPKASAKRADIETEKVEKLIVEVKRLKFSNGAQFKKALDQSGLKPASNDSAKNQSH